MRPALLLLLSLPVAAAELRLAEVRTDPGLDRAGVERLVVSKLPDLARCLSVEWSGVESVDPPRLTLSFTAAGTVDASTWVSWPLSGSCTRELSRTWSLGKKGAAASAVVTLEAKTTLADHAAMRDGVRRDLSAICAGLKGTQGAAPARISAAMDQALANPELGVHARAAIRDVKDRLDGHAPKERFLAGPGAALSELSQEAGVPSFCPELSRLSLEVLVPKPAIPVEKLAELLSKSPAKLEECRSLKPTDDEDGLVVVRIGSARDGKAVDVETVSAHLLAGCVHAWVEEQQLPPTVAEFFDVKAPAARSLIDRVRDASALAGTSRVALHYVLDRAKRSELRAQTEAGLEHLCAAVEKPGVAKALKAMASNTKLPREVQTLVATLGKVDPNDAKALIAATLQEHDLARTGPCTSKLSAR